MQELQQQQTEKICDANPEDIIFRLKSMIKILGEQNGGNEPTATPCN